MNEFESGDLVHIPAGVLLIKYGQQSIGLGENVVKSYDKPVIGIFIETTTHESYYHGGVLSYKVFYDSDYWYVDPKYTYVIENENNKGE